MRRNRWLASLFTALAVLCAGGAVNVLSPLAPAGFWIAVAVMFALVAVAFYVWPTSQDDESTYTPNPPPSADPREMMPFTEPIVQQSRPLGAEYTHRTVQEMVAEYEGKTELQGRQATEVYIGKRIQIGGTIDDVYPIGEGLSVTIDTDHPFARLSLSLHLEFPALAALETANVGDIIEARGKIERVRTYDVRLVDCELLSIRPPDSAR